MDNYNANNHMVDLWLDDLARNDLHNLLQDIPLSAEEHLKSSSFHFEKHQRHYRLAHQYLRWVLGQYLNCAPGNVVFTHNEHGKPELSPAHNNQHLQFNLSHSESFIAVAIGKQHALGVDIEVIEKHKEVDKLAAHCFSEQELAQLLQLPEGEKNIEFYRHWSRKEAYIKALGTGLNTRPNSFSINLHALENPVIVANINSQETCAHDNPSANNSSVKNAAREGTWKLWSIDALEKQGCTCALATQDMIVSVNSKSLLNTHLVDSVFPYSIYGYS